MKSAAFLSVFSALGGAYAACSSPVTLTGNPFATHTLYANGKYAAEVQAAAATITDPTLKAAALQVANVGSFLWLDTMASLQTFQQYITPTPCDQIFGFVVYDLPGRDCAAKASNGELPVGSINTYMTQYIDPLVTIVKANPNTAFVAIIEPDSLPNLVTNSNLTTCANSAAGYRQGVQYALKQLNLPNVVMYIDAGHGGWLGWNANLQPGATELANAYIGAGKPSQVRGISTNVAGWNAWIDIPGEFANASDAQYNSCQDENRYVNTFIPYLNSAGFPAHAITDTGRNAVQGLRLAWGDWCNVNGAGFGVRPTSNTGNSLADAFVWVKPGGESDGTSNSSATRYDSFCGMADAFKPSPEAGQWNEAYFEMLLKNAKPSFGAGGSTSSTPPPTSTTTTSTSTSSTSAPAATQTHYGQCGGTGYSGPTVCATGFTCTAVSPPYYYQCL